MNLISRPPTLFLFHPNGIPNGIPTHCFGLWSSIISLSRMESSDGLLPHSLSLSPLSIYPRQPRQYRKKKTRVTNEGGGCWLCFLSVVHGRSRSRVTQTPTHPHVQPSVSFLFVFLFSFCFCYFWLGTQRCLFVFSPPFACLLADGWMTSFVCFREFDCTNVLPHNKKTKKNKKTTLS